MRVVCRLHLSVVIEGEWHCQTAAAVPTHVHVRAPEFMAFNYKRHWHTWYSGRRMFSASSPLVWLIFFYLELHFLQSCTRSPWKSTGIRGRPFLDQRDSFPAETAPKEAKMCPIIDAENKDYMPCLDHIGPEAHLYSFVRRVAVSRMSQACCTTSSGPADKREAWPAAHHDSPVCSYHTGT